jgi:putative membrane protein insertion efficiency factor
MNGIYERCVLTVLRAYKLTLSPYIGQACRFQPTCSDYMAQSLIRHGPVTGSWLGIKRICRCRPGGGFGADPVPLLRGQDQSVK